MDREFRMIVIVQSTINMGSVLMLGDLRAYLLEKILKMDALRLNLRAFQSPSHAS